MGRAGITLATTDKAAANIFDILLRRGFRETSMGVYERDEILLFPIPREIVPVEDEPVPRGPDPYPIDYDLLASEYDVDYFLVASRHWARSGQPSLTTHATGNFGEARLGGRDHELQPVPAVAMRNVYEALKKSPPAGFTVSLEATHHSPTQFKVPMFFAEVGSSEAQWSDVAACEYLVDAILDGIKSDAGAPRAIGFGGGHYCPKFSVMEGEYAFGHIAAKYAVPSLNDDLIRQMIEKTGGVEKAFVESGLKGSEKTMLKATLGRMGVDCLIV
jgi:D-tyrosyl-tRNA(Tyr) deacylase